LCPDYTYVTHERQPFLSFREHAASGQDVFLGHSLIWNSQLALHGSGRVLAMDSFYVGLLTGLLAGPLLLAALVCLFRLTIMRWLTRYVSRWASVMFWRGVQKLIDLLDELLARKREREAGELSSPNLISPTSGEMVIHTRTPSAR
jgi:hypothetical protein